MKASVSLFRPRLFTVLLATLVACSIARAGDEDNGVVTGSASSPKSDLVRQVAYDAAFYQRLQLDPATIVPDWVVAQAKGVLILERWPGAPTVAGNGQGIGLLKNPKGKFSAPVFYTLGDSSIGLQIGPASVHLVAFLMTDRALLTLTGNQFSWSGQLRAAAGNSTSSGPHRNNPDVLLFQKAANLDANAIVSAVKVSVNDANNALFYDKPGVTPADIFNAKVKMPDAAASLVDAFNQQAGPPTSTATAK
jgi:lipid-binding SYLF domain-containing protein